MGEERGGSLGPQKMSNTILKNSWVLPLQKHWLDYQGHCTNILDLPWNNIEVSVNLKQSKRGKSHCRPQELNTHTHTQKNKPITSTSISIQWLIFQKNVLGNKKIIRRRSSKPLLHQQYHHLKTGCLFPTFFWNPKVVDLNYTIHLNRANEL